MTRIDLAREHPSLDALLAALEAAGGQIELVRDGRPIARLALAPAADEAASSNEPDTAAAVFREMMARRDALALAFPASTAPISWEELKAEMYPDDAEDILRERDRS